jgi:nucleotide-binding universal stress UspA family protein
MHIAAFRRAAEAGSSLTFLHVLGGQDFDEQPERMRAAIQTEMEWLLHVLVRVAQDRSEASDVPVSVVVRIGDPAATILEVVQEIEPEMLLVGVPREGGASVFHDTRFNHFVARVEELGVRIEIVSTKPGA